MKKSLILAGMLCIGYASAQEERVGINTETPSATLNVKTKTDAKSAKNLELENQAGTKLMTVLNNGNVGINNASPEYILDINASGKSSYNQSSVRLKIFRDGNTNSGAFDILRARGTASAPTKNLKGDALGSIGFLGYTGNKYLNAFRISSAVREDVSDTLIPADLRFIRYYDDGKESYPLTIAHTGNIGINNVLEPTVALEIRANAATNTEQQIANGKNDAIFIDVNAGIRASADTKEQKVTISGGMKGFHPNYRSHGIDFGLIDLNTSTRPFMAFSVAPYQGYPSNEDKTVEHMRIMHTGNIGIGTTAPTHKLHIKADTNPLKLEGLQTGTGEALVVDADGVVKKGSAVASASTPAVSIGSTTGMQCDATNRGKMNFIQGADGKSDVFGICMKNANGNYYWAYMIGGNNPSNGSGAFGSGL